MIKEPEDEHETRIRAACQILMKESYFTGFDYERRERRYAMVKELSKELIGYDVDYETLT